MICSSWPVPSVATTSAWVSPRVNKALPWTRGKTLTSATIGRTVRGVAPVDPLAGIQDRVAHDRLLDPLELARAPPPPSAPSSPREGSSACRLTASISSCRACLEGSA